MVECVDRGERQLYDSKKSSEGFKMKGNGKFKGDILSLLRSTRGLAIPVTFLMLFVALIIIISTTYSFAVIKISSRGAFLKASVAKRSMLMLDHTIRNIVWLPGSSQTIYFDDYGGVLKVEPVAKRLFLNLTDGGAFSRALFNAFVGRAIYKLQPTKEGEVGLFLRGGAESVINKSSSAMAQIYISATSEGPEVVLSYRPFVSSVANGEINGKTKNVLRIYIINLNNSDSLEISGEFYLKISTTNVTLTVHTYEFNNSLSSLAIQASLDNVETTVWLPISSTAEGAIVDVEVVTCFIKLQKVEV